MTSSNVWPLVTVTRSLDLLFVDSLKLLLEKANAVRTTNPKQPRSWNRITQITLLTLFNVIVFCLILWSCFPISARMLCFLMDYPTALKMLTSLNTLRSLRMGKYQRFNWKKKKEKSRAEESTAESHVSVVPFQILSVQVGRRAASIEGKNTRPSRGHL